MFSLTIQPLRYWITIKDGHFLKRTVKYICQIFIRGWCDADTWSLDYTIAKFTLPRLKRFKKINNGFPSSLSEKEWNIILDKMIRAFELCILDGDSGLLKLEYYDEMEEGLELFGKHFRELWW